MSIRTACLIAVAALVAGCGDPADAEPRESFLRMQAVDEARVELTHEANAWAESEITR